MRWGRAILVTGSWTRISVLGAGEATDDPGDVLGGDGVHASNVGTGAGGGKREDISNVPTGEAGVGVSMATSNFSVPIVIELVFGGADPAEVLGAVVELGAIAVTHEGAGRCVGTMECRADKAMDVA